MRRIFTRKSFQVALIAANVLLVAWLMRAHEFAFLEAARNIVFDEYQRFKPREKANLPVRIVDIDDEAIRTYGQWPWPRVRLTLLVERLVDLGATTIAFDMVFSEPDRTNPAVLFEEVLKAQGGVDAELARKLAALPDSDEVFARSLSAVPTVIGFFGTVSENAARPRQTAGFVFAGEDPKKSLVAMEGAIASLPVLQEAAAGVGSISLSGGRASDVIRRVPLFLTDGEAIYPALSIETLRLATGASTYILKTTSASGETSAGAAGITAARVGEFVVPTTAEGEIQLYYARDDASDYVSAGRLLAEGYRDLAPLIENHIIFVGTSAVGLSDTRVTALGETVPGVSLHAQIVQQILIGGFLQRPDWASGAEMAMAIAVTLLMMLVLPYTGAIVSAAIGAACSAGVLAISWIAFDRYGVLVDPLFAMATGGAVYILSVMLTFAATERERRFVRSAFQHYLAPPLLKKLEHSPELLVLGGETREITMMFMDIRNFTGISEKLTPNSLVAFINQLFSPLSDIIQDNEGVIDKYIGDSIMAFWNAPLDVRNHTRKACLAALRMRDEVVELNAGDVFGFKRGEIGMADVQIGIGINAGEACVGNMGSSSRFNYSVVGDTVNTASRIESHTKEAGWPILVSRTVVEAVPDMAFLPIGNLLLKGKSRGVDLYALVGDEEFARSSAFQLLKQRQKQSLPVPGVGVSAHQ